MRQHLPRKRSLRSSSAPETTSGFESRMTSMADLVLESVQQIGLQSLDKALSLVSTNDGVPHEKAKEIASQTLLRTKHLDKEINRFFTNTRSVSKS